MELRIFIFLITMNNFLSASYCPGERFIPFPGTSPRHSYNQSPSHSHNESSYSHSESESKFHNESPSYLHSESENNALETLDTLNDKLIKAIETNNAKTVEIIVKTIATAFKTTKITDIDLENIINSGLKEKKSTNPFITEMLELITLTNKKHGITKTITFIEKDLEYVMEINGVNRKGIRELNSM